MEISGAFQLEIDEISANNLESAYESPIRIQRFTQGEIQNFQFNSLQSLYKNGGCISISFDITNYWDASIMIRNGIFNGCSSPSGNGGCMHFDSTALFVQILIIALNLELSNCLAFDGAAIYVSSRLILNIPSAVNNVTITKSTATGGAIISDSHPLGSLSYLNMLMHNNTGLNAGIASPCSTSFYTYQSSFYLIFDSIEISNSYSLESVILFQCTYSHKWVLFANMFIHDIFTPNGEYSTVFTFVRANIYMYDITVENTGLAINAASLTYLEVYYSVFTRIYGVLLNLIEECYVWIIGCDVSYVTNSVILANFNSYVTLCHSNIHHNTNIHPIDPLIFHASAINYANFYYENSFTDNLSIFTEVFYFGRTEVIIHSCNFARNFGKYTYSSGIVLHESQGCINNSTFDSQISENQGGFVYLYDAWLQISASNFSGGSAPYGGVVYSFASILSIYSSIFSNNSASFGGAIYAEQSTVDIFNSEFISGYSEYGCGLASVDGIVSITGSSFVNSEYIRGSLSSSLYVDTSNITIDSTIFSSSQTEVVGIYTENTVSIEISNSIFQNNSATTGGALTSIGSAPYGSVVITNSSFIDNFSFGSGAGLWIQDMELQMIDCTVSGNLAEIDGGGMYLSAPSCTTCTFSIEGSTNITNNTCKIYGGGILWEDYKPNLESTVKIANNTSLLNDSVAGPACSLQSSSQRSLS